MKVKGGVSFSVLPKYNSVFRLGKLSTFPDMGGPNIFYLVTQTISVSTFN